MSPREGIDVKLFIPTMKAVRNGLKYKEMFAADSTGAAMPDG